MDYTKTIMYGDNLEIYEYELSPVPHKKPVRDSKKPRPTEEEKFGRRKDNMLQAQRNFRRLVGANLSYERPLLITLTYAENMTDIAVGYHDYRSFVQALRYKFGKRFKYIGVPEFQKRGAVHFHVLFWGMPRHLLGERNTRTLADVWRHGFVDVIETDGSGKLASYLAKYMAKAFTDSRLKNQKAYVSSRNVQRPVIESGGLVLSALFQNVAEDEKPLFDTRYSTRWLGNCRHRLFKTQRIIL